MPRPPRSTLFPTRRSSDLPADVDEAVLGCQLVGGDQRAEVRRRTHRLRAPLAGSPVGHPTSALEAEDRKSTRLNSSHTVISYAVFCLKKKKTDTTTH